MSRQIKATLRSQCRAIREGMSPEKVAQSSQAVCELLSNWPVLRGADTVLSFLAFRNEIDLSELFERWPEKRWLVPRVAESERQKSYLMLHIYDPSRLVRHRFGMLEPKSDLPVVDPSEVELVLAPGVAFDRRGGRLGFGGGFYDRLMPLASQAARFGVTYDELVVDAVPMEPWDCYVDWLVTQSGIWDTDKSGLAQPR